MSSKEINIRPALPEDIPSINVIHKHYVENTVITFTVTPNTDEAALDNYHKIKNDGLPYIVAMDSENNEAMGYAYVSSFRSMRLGYRHSLELSLFCHPEQVRKGIGKQLLLRLIEVLKHPEHSRDYFEGTRLLDFKPQQILSIMAVDIDGPGEGLALRDWYLQFGFEERGRLKGVGWKRGRWIDTIYLQLSLTE